MGGVCSGCFEGLSGQHRRCVPPLLRDAAVSGFTAAFGAKPAALGVAPGRAEVLGNHTDYNEGYILAAAINRYVVAAGSAHDRRSCRLSSDAFKGVVVEFSIDSPSKQSGEKSWANYVIGVVDELCKLGVKVGGFDAFLTSDVPPGAGVSSSAAVEMATAKLLARLFPDTVGKLDALTLIKAAKAAENNFVGMGCGILDQFSSGMGRSGSLLFLDCRTLDYSYVPFKGAVFVLANTHAPHQLVDGKYDELRTSCFSAAAALREATGNDNITHLRDVSPATFESHSLRLSHPQRRVSHHIVLENERVQTGIKAAKSGDMKLLGEMMSASHCSSRDSFGNSCKELDIMQELAEQADGFLGARLMGGGFGGSTINLVKESCAQKFAEDLAKLYKAKTGIDATMLICGPGDGAFSAAVA